MQKGVGWREGKHKLMQNSELQYNVGVFESAPSLPSPSGLPYQVAVAGCHCGSEIWKESAELMRESNAGRRKKRKRMEDEKEREAIRDEGGSFFLVQFCSLFSLLRCLFANLRPLLGFERAYAAAPMERKREREVERDKESKRVE